ncbi:carbamoyl-phosphate synthase large subunit [bacterium]|nr:carbamoyl-phosphate synthase large subunit [bacterium]
MPRDPSLKSILIIGSGPIVIGQACEFDYSGTQACKALRDEGIRVVLVNSNPATIMTDPDVADRTYVEPVTVEALRKILSLEKPDAVLPTLGGQTGLNMGCELARRGILAANGTRMIGATLEVIERAEDRQKFKSIAEGIGLECPRAFVVKSMEEARTARQSLGLPLIVRPSFTLGGAGGGIAYNVDEFDDICDRGLRASPIHEVLVEESVIGWKEFELEVVRDRKDNVIIVCSIENVDAMGVHTGDSITVAPALTLSDREYHRMRDASIALIRAIGVDTGGSNIQFAVNPRDGRMVVIEMNPRVSRSSALASKATGFPIAKFAAKLAIGYTLDELKNDITKTTPASFEPAIDYIVTKVPRFNFEKFPGCDATLTTSMKSVGEAMAIGRTWKESLQKALRSLETGRMGIGLDRHDRWLSPETRPTKDAIREKLTQPNHERIFYLRYAILAGMTPDEISQLSGIDPWFVHEIRQLCEEEAHLRTFAEKPLAQVPVETIREAKRQGFSDAQLAKLWGKTEDDVRAERLRKHVRPVYKLVDTCAAEFRAATPYFYSTYESEDDDPLRFQERLPKAKPKVVILGGGPNRIGQGIEFDYCCVHAALALREDGYETIMINSNPETVSTDYDTSDRLYFEPLTLEDVLNVYQRERPLGAIVQLAGQTPLNLARRLEANGVKVLGTSPSDIHLAEDREAFDDVLNRLQLLRPQSGIASTFEEARALARKIGYPVMVRPSYVLGGRAMHACYDDEELREYLKLATEASEDHPVLIDEFLEDAIEVDVDVLADGEKVVLGGVLEHIEEAGVHSGDASCAIPPYTLSPILVDRMRRDAVRLALALRVRGLMNVQYAVKEDTVYVLEVNPRASRTVPFVAKATGRPLAKIAARIMVGKTLAELGVEREIAPPRFAVKKSVFPWNRFPGCDLLLGPEMRSTGEVMGVDRDFGAAFAKAQSGGSEELPRRGKVFLSVRDDDKRELVYVAKKLQSLGFELAATSGTLKVLEKHGVDNVSLVHKIRAGRPDPLDLIRNGDVAMVINTPSAGKLVRVHERSIRALAVARAIPCMTTIAAAAAAVNAIDASLEGDLGVEALQDVLASQRK